MFLDGAFTHSEAAAACGEKHGSLAMARDSETFRVLRSMLDASRAPSDDRYTGAWLDGKRDANFVWQCESNKIVCGRNMPWTHGAPSYYADEGCVLLYLPYQNGVVNYICTRKLSAICEVK